MRKIYKLLRFNFFLSFLSYLKYGKLYEYVYKGTKLKIMLDAKIVYGHFAKMHIGKPEFDDMKAKTTELILSKGSKLVVEGNVVVESGCLISLSENTSLELLGNLYMMSETKIKVNGKSYIGNGVRFGRGVVIDAKYLKVGDNVYIGSNCKINGCVEIPSNTTIPTGSVYNL